MLHDVVLVWPGSCNDDAPWHTHKFDFQQHVATGQSNARNMLRPTMLRYVMLKCCDRLSGVLHYNCLLTTQLTSKFVRTIFEKLSSTLHDQWLKEANIKNYLKHSTCSDDHPFPDSSGLLYSVMQTVIQCKQMVIMLRVRTHPVMTFPWSGPPTPTLPQDFLFLAATLRSDPLQLNFLSCTINKLDLHWNAHLSIWFELVHRTSYQIKEHDM